MSAHYLDGEDGRVFVKMYPGRAVGISFPTDGNKHYEAWAQRKYPVLINNQSSEVVVNTYEDGTLISIEVGLPSDIVTLSAEQR